MPPRYRGACAGTRRCRPGRPERSTARDKNQLPLKTALTPRTKRPLTLFYLRRAAAPDELVFDGASFALNADPSVAAQLPAFRENIATLRWSKTDTGWRCSGPIAPVVDGDKGDYAACVLGLRDYVRENGFPRRPLGNSRGVPPPL